jgi:hypothetical protein
VAATEDVADPLGAVGVDAAPVDDVGNHAGRPLGRVLAVAGGDLGRGPAEHEPAASDVGAGLALGEDVPEERGVVAEVVGIERAL